jgi:hypothetical protein
VNVYVFDPQEETVSCCSCPVTPDGLVSLSAQNDLIANPLFSGAAPTSIVIKLLATVPVAGSCVNSALLAGNPQLALGMVAWGTTLEPNTTTGAFTVQDKPFTDAILSAGELTRLQYSCGFAVGQGSTGGICNSCRLGGLGGEKQ